jgi:hypothetical protein
MFTSPERKSAAHTSLRAIAIVAILVVALFGGLFHHHNSESESAACPYCHAGLEKPIADLAVVLAVPLFSEVGYVNPTQCSQTPPVLRFSTLIPRAPPASTHPALSWESCAGLA